MPLYDFKCPEGDVFEAFFMMEEKPGTLSCPRCGQDAVGVIPAISPAKTNSAQMRILDATKASADQPQVVNSIFGTRTAKRRPTVISNNPLHEKLPKP